MPLKDLNDERTGVLRNNHLVKNVEKHGKARMEGSICRIPNPFRMKIFRIRALGNATPWQRHRNRKKIEFLKKNKMCGLLRTFNGF